MKNYFAAALFLAASIAAAPAVPAYISGREKAPAAGDTAAPGGSGSASASGPESTGITLKYASEPYKVLDTASGEILEVPVRDYVIGAVCAEMPASFCEEALKAQAVAAHTYAERQRERERSQPDSELLGADFSNDPSKYQGYFTREQAEKLFGESFSQNYAKISAAVDEVLPYILTYNGEPAIPAFHSMSSGRTESAENAWGTAVDYLVPVDSSADTSAPEFLRQQRIGRDDLKAALMSAFPGISPGEDMSQWVRVCEVSDSGTVLAAEVCGAPVTGSEIRSALGLRSACFDVRIENDEAVFTTRGSGHGVGMSQFGAEAMARDGSSWRDILAHYYPGCSVI